MASIYRVVLSVENEGNEVREVEARSAAEAIGASLGERATQPAVRIWDNGAVSAGGTGRLRDKLGAIMAMRTGLTPAEAQAELEASEALKAQALHERLAVKPEDKSARAIAKAKEAAEYWWLAEVCAWKRADAAQDALKAAAAKQAAKEWTPAQCLARQRKLANAPRPAAKQAKASLSLPMLAEACEEIEAGGKQLPMF